MSQSSPVEVDVLVVGAGFGGICALHHLRERGFRVRVVEKGGGVGGTWYWNRYPGARCDVPSLEYSYGFSAELARDWDWTEIMAGQAEIESYLNHVVDRFDLRGDIECDTEVDTAYFDEATSRWLIGTTDGRQYLASFCVMATGNLSVPTEPSLPNLDAFEGEVLQTSRWPSTEPDFAGKRVGIIGTGSSGIQLAPIVAEQAAELIVFQRTPTFAFPAGNGRLDPGLVAAARRDHVALRRKQRTTYLGVAGFGGNRIPRGTRSDRILETSPADRLRRVDELGWEAPRDWSDVMIDLRANAAGADLYRELIRRTVHDPEVAAALSPLDMPMGCKRIVLHTGYFEMFNRENVRLVDLRRGALQGATPSGVRTGGGHIDLDVICFATGFDAMTGALLRMDIRGRDGRLLADTWVEGPRTLLGIQSAGFPNLFMLTGPGSPSVLANMVLALEQHVEWVADALTAMRDRGARQIEPAESAQDEWFARVNSLADGTMFTAPGCQSWYLGSNIPGKPRAFMPYIGGFDAYVRECEQVVADGYRGFVIS